MKQSDANFVAALGPACNRIRDAIRRLGPIGGKVEAGAVETIAVETLDENDCISLIQSWMGSRLSSAGDAPDGRWGVLGGRWQRLPSVTSTDGIGWKRRVGPKMREWNGDAKNAT